VRIGAQVGGFLLGGPGMEMDRPVGLHGHQWRHVRPTIGPDRRDPEQLGRLKHPAGLIPPGGYRVRTAGREWSRGLSSSFLLIRSIEAFQHRLANAAEIIARTRTGLAALR
jgi:hypothetical protein